MKLGLGTVQFGMDYGVSNRQGKTSLEEALDVLSAAAQSGISVLDTASTYGVSEKVLGLLLPREHSFRITTKLPRLVPQDGGAFDPGEADRLLEDSLSNLHQSFVYGLILHRADDLLSIYGDEIMRWLQKCKRRGLAIKVGVSVYPEEGIEEIIDRYPIDLIQAPVNLFDQRLVRNGFLRRCKERGIEVHARSVLLQGLLCMEPHQLPAYFQPYKAQIQKYRSFLSEQAIDPIDAALSFVNELPEIDVFLCGVNNCEQLLQLVSSVRQSRIQLDYSGLSLSDPGLLNPYQWKIN
ncbi:aldo/keto reductase [Cohnella silvisoli]|uniref:Aldo/keto reductase n=1 Tax=Cohnella silvisoli TaxID=2873699 RepID=A0ABV1KVZ6_9BACL|nr:aldo/keto reductase [Cohnella silvisoli]MCD9023667.1 aldo/keto reductase [Cohnella silvisoli]